MGPASVAKPHVDRTLALRRNHAPTASSSAFRLLAVRLDASAAQLVVALNGVVVL